MGSILLDAAKVFDFCKEKGLRPSSFHVRAHQTLFELMEIMASDNRPIDVLSVSERLQTSGRLDEVGGIAALDRLLEATPTPAHAEYYIDIVR
ncbi:MAG: replicative DNA helicase, partial [Lentisphaerae bacterium]|nr:replicative DNA helicase [Lentisphaerota bacterium]